MVMMKVSPLRPIPTATSNPITVEYQCGSREMIRSTAVKVTVRKNRSRPGALIDSIFWAALGLVWASCSCDSLRSDEERTIQITKYKTMRNSQNQVLR